jgi:mannose-6-phosphate isomerase
VKEFNRELSLGVTKNMQLKLENFYSPLRSEGERAWRTYIGGKNIDRLTNREFCEDSHFPELWILSTVQARNANREDIVEGLSTISVENQWLSLKEVIETYPKQMLGDLYSGKFGTSMGVLVKIIDAQERLTIQVHPTKPKAREYFNSEYGKTECWHILETREGENSCIYMGFKENVTKEQFVSCFEKQDLKTMLSLLHRVPVQKGETYIIRGGIPHAIGAGCTLIEIQEPTDYTLRVEKTTPGGFCIDEKACHLGIGIEKMMDCFSFEGKSLEETLGQCKLGYAPLKENGCLRTPLVGYGDTSCFRMEKLYVEDTLSLKPDSSFFGLYVLEGEGVMHSYQGEESLVPGNQFFVSPLCKDFTLEAKGGPLVLIRFWGQQV